MTLLRQVASGAGLGGLLFLGACAALPLAGAAGGGAAVAWLALTASAVKDADDVLAIAKPINGVLCKRELAKPHTPDVAAAMQAFCANLPSDVGGLLIQAAAIFAAIEVENHPI